MQFRILGPLEIRRADNVVHLEGREERALTVRLLLAGGRAVPPARLVDDIWARERPPDAESRLAHHLARLQHALDPDLPADTAGGVLVSDATGYRLMVGPDEVDAIRFETLVTEGREALQAGNPARAEERFRAALMMWWGDALGDVAREPFARDAAARLEALWRSAAEGRIEALLALGHVREARADLENLIETVRPAGRPAAPAPAPVAAGSGNPPGALRPTNDALPLDVLPLDVVAPARSPAGVAPGPAAPAAPRHDRGDEHPPPLLGRERELRLLESLLDESRSGQRRIVVLSGEAGVGKTRLVAEVVGRARAQGALVAAGHAHPGQGAPPYWPWVQALRTMLSSAPRETVAAAFAPHRSVVTRLVPEVGALLPGTRGDDDPVSASTARSRLAEAVTRSLGWIADERPVVVVLEDLHRADAATLFLLRFLVASPPAGSLLVLVTYRTGDPEPEVERALAPFRGGRSLVSLELEGLRDPEVAELLAGRGCGGLGPDEVAAIGERTGGNPFFVEETARALRRAGVDSPGGHPPAGRGLLRHHLGDLPAPTRELLEVAAVMGQAVDPAALEVLVGDAAARLGPAVESHTLVASNGPSSPLRFRHDLLWATIYDDLDPARRAELHGAVGAALRDAGGRPVDEVAEHLWLAADAGLRQYADQAVSIALDAADQGMDLSSVEHAADHLERATVLVSGEARPAVRSEREVQIGARRVRLHEIDEGVLTPEIATAVRSVWSAVRGPAVVAEMAATGRTGWTHHVLRGELTPARALAEDLVRRGTDASEPGTLAVGLICLGHARFQAGEPEAARAALERGLEIADAQDASDGPLHRDRVRARAFLCPVLELLGESSRARGMLDGALAHAARADDAIELRMSAALAGVIAGDATRTVVAAREGEDIARTRSLGLYLPLARALVGWAAVHLGDPSGEWDLDEALQQLDAMGLRWMRATRLGLRAEAAVVARGDVDAALGYLDAALDEAEDTGERIFEPELHRLRAELIAAAGEADGADQALARAFDLARSSGAKAFEERARTTARSLGLPAAG